MNKQGNINIDIWNQIHRSKSWEAFYPTADAQSFVKHHISGGRILDLGCGTGSDSLYFNELGLEVYSCDTSQKALDELRMHRYGNSIMIQQADFRSLPYDSSFFDYIFCHGVLYYGNEENFISGINEIYRCLKPNGIARIYTKSNQDYWVKYGKPIGKNTFIAQNHEWENDLLIYCIPYEKITEYMKKFNHLVIGIDEFNYVGLDSRKSFWVITATK